MTANTPWRPLDVPETRGCSVCGERDCRRPRCVKHNSFGLGVTTTGDLQPGDYKVFHTLRDMSAILRNPSNKTEHPLDLHPGNDIVDLVHETFPLLPPSDDYPNLEMRKKSKKQNNIAQDHHAPDQPDRNSTTNFQSSEAFLSSTTGVPSPAVDDPQRQHHRTWLKEKGSAMST